MEFFEASEFAATKSDNLEQPKKSIFAALDEPETLPMRKAFPVAGEEYMGGTSDGYVYSSIFAGANLDITFEMVRDFLKEEGYGDIPLPKDAKELSKFRLSTRNRQILLFEDNGYVHNPIKILFPIDGRQKRTLTLEVYNESFDNHLLLFHRRIDEE